MLTSWPYPASALTRAVIVVRGTTSTLPEGVVTVIDGGSRRQFEVHGGFADVTPAGLTILAEQASEVTAA